MDETEAGMLRFRQLVRSVADDVEVVIPSRATGGHFKIALNRGPSRKFISLLEDDLIQLGEDNELDEQILAQIQEAVEQL